MFTVFQVKSVSDSAAFVDIWKLSMSQHLAEFLVCYQMLKVHLLKKNEEMDNRAFSYFAKDTVKFWNKYVTEPSWILYRAECFLIPGPVTGAELGNTRN